MTDRIHKVLENWHQIMTGGASEGLRELLSPDCTFWSPVVHTCLLYTSPSPRDGLLSRMPSSA